MVQVKSDFDTLEDIPETATGMTWGPTCTLRGTIESPGNVKLLKGKTYGKMRDVFMNLDKKAMTRGE